MNIEHTDPSIVAQVRAIVMRERTMSVSDREWKHRLRGYGYALSDTDHGRVVTTLPHGVEVCTLG